MKKTEKEPIKVFVVDDSLFMRRLISEILNADAGITVIDTAKSGREALEKLATLKPDVITLDLIMPGGDGLSTLRRIMREHPIPTIIVSAHTEKEVETTMECLEAGAVSFVLKPSGEISLDIKKVKEELIEKVKIAARVSPITLKRFLRERPRLAARKVNIIPAPKGRMMPKDRIIVIGASTGGPATIEKIICELPKSFPAPIIVVQHMPAKFTTTFAKRLNNICAMDVREAQQNDIVKPGLVLVAPGDRQMTVEAGTRNAAEGIIIVRKKQTEEEISPNIDLAMKSVAEVYRERAVGILLTGMGEDGVEGLRHIQKNRGRTMAQDEATSLIYGMPKRAKEQGVADEIVPLSKISAKLMELL